METRILVFDTQSDAAGAVAKMSATMGLTGSTFLFALPRPLADGRWFIPRPSDDAWLAGVPAKSEGFAQGHTTAEGTGLVAVGEAAAARPFVPDRVPNADLRIILQGMFLPDGRSYFAATDGFLAGQRDATSGLDDADPAKQAALGAWTQWDMGNFFHRRDPLVAALGGMFGLSDVDLDALFQAAGARS